MQDKKAINVEFDKLKDKIIKELEQGKDIILKMSPGGLKVQSLQVNTLK